MFPEALLRRLAPIAVVAATVLVPGCHRERSGPVVAETSIEPLRSEAKNALEAVGEARDRLAADPDRAREALDRAHSSLVRLNDFYLPVLEARDRALNAHRYLATGRAHRALDELVVVEELLHEASRSGSPTIAAELEPPLDMAAEARSAVEAGTSEGPAAVERLVQHLNFLEIKGGLALRPDH